MFENIKYYSNSIAYFRVQHINVSIVPKYGEKFCRNEIYSSDLDSACEKAITPGGLRVKCKKHKNLVN